MHGKDFDIRISNKHRIRFTSDTFAADSRVLIDLLETNGHAKVLAFIDNGVAEAFPELQQQVNDYLDRMPGFVSRGTIVQTGGEFCKRDANTLQAAWDAIEKAGIDRHSYILCIGGGAYLDVIGLAAATAHRGIRLVRFPTTCLSQDDSGVGVKNGINAYGKKNFLGSFAVPYAVVNDFTFLHGQPETERRAGLVEAVKVALVKDASFFHWIEDNAEQLSELKPHALEEVVERSALLHASHIAYGGDPFETGNSRPLDYGHWAAHKMEQLTDFALSHADAVGVGVALDTVYSWKTGRLDEESAMRVLKVLITLKLDIWHPALTQTNADGQRSVFLGLEEFREHLGGELTVLLLKDLGKGEDVHTMDTELLAECIEWLEVYSGALKS
ncbi:3-dehydroquinate synthase [Verrucomicrobiaceae bacterium R5-34]|uniref:3-dehydroquinate synthase n=1 Tax=Oceaniferula flava TaxID=2800421 RepID=A0AAE2VBF6_9BACT|nr:3-dehydroquinate synthase [Oceaniferula flavus]MBK1830398.1 3-dehydroquinate synthase [Verrucomicrobiaceae bacterium R5-34]MBK1854490.1 3-dehydroquinate synthase [Oceaniferula flavus]MBM1135796.1 3-dehydroquinate synthase [Oceaniferula flavus]